jgi:small subunit ribosomal protein S5
MRLSVLVVAGDKNGRVGAGIGKGADVRTAEEKAFKQAKKNMVKINRKKNTIPHTVSYKKGAAKIILRPASPGTGIIAGGAIRAVVELAGIKDILSKILGTSNKNSNVYATIEALKTLME